MGFAPVSRSPASDASEGTAVEAVLERLLIDLMQGRYAPGSRLPAERELAKAVGASRPTLREALRRLGEWQLIEPRRGSGIEVRPLADWSIEVLPAYLRYSRPAPGLPNVSRLLLDLLALRRMIMREIARLVAPRMRGGGTRAAREHLRRAWDSRHDAVVFVREDFLVIRAVVESAGMLPAVWMLNRLAGVYLDVATAVARPHRVPDDYVASTTQYLDALDRNDGDTAAERITAYLERHDAGLVQALEAMA